MELTDSQLPWWTDDGKMVEVETGTGTMTGRLVIVDQSPGPDEVPIFAVEVDGKQHPFDCAKRWRFVDA